MKNRNIYILSAALASFFSCATVDEDSLGVQQPQQELVEMTFQAVIEDGADTKTSLDGKPGDVLRKVLWNPGDRIGICGTSAHFAGFQEFAAKIDTPSEISEFDGRIEIKPEYWAFYPVGGNSSYNPELASAYLGYDAFVVNFPSLQKYVNGSFDPDCAPMVARFDFGETIGFKNLCGILALQLKGSESVKSISFMSVGDNRRQVSGHFAVYPAQESGDYISPMYDAGIYPNPTSSHNSVTLECGSPVALSPDSPTPFYLVLPPATYDYFVVCIETVDGRVMVKEGKNPLTIKRSDVAYASALEYAESVSIDLSERGNSNCYIVPKTGLYSFDATVIGNREFGIIPGAGFHTDSPSIQPENVELLWQDTPGVVSHVAYSDGRISFVSTGNEGNALIAAKDTDGKILWSWHIWSTDQPQEHEYVNATGRYTVLDRNLGATHNASDKVDESRGLMYQWGRKDPFAADRERSVELLYTTNNTQATIEEAIANPTVFEGMGYRGWVKQDNQVLWHPAKKTVYDPCPVGYRVANRNIWSGFLQDGLTNQWGMTEKYNVSGGWDYGWNFLYDGVNSSYFPVTSFITYDGYYQHHNEYCMLWSSEYSYERWAYHLQFYFYNDASSNIDMNYTGETAAAYPVRCMKDEGYVDTALPTVRVVNVTDKTANSVRILSEVTYEGASEVTERGVILSPTPDFNEVITVKRGSGLGQYEHYYYNLTEATRYYVKAYAVNSYGVSFSDVIQFATAYSGGGTNLSDAGVANSYMVMPSAGTFFFDASVKGNSSESTGLLSSAELIWAVDENHNSSDNVIQNVQLNGNLVFFQTPESVVPGNALIAVKDHNGQILWSWHIWVVDYEPETDYQTYYSGAKMMDRNLGASKAMPELADYVSTWKPAAGTLYQWGRKDPIIYEICSIQHNSFSSVEEAAANPSAFGAGGDYWLSPFDEYLWLPDSKTKYDPCPAGWRVAPKSAWDGMTCSATYNPHGMLMNVGQEEKIWVGFGPYMHSGGDYFEHNGNGYTWTSDYNHGSIHGWTVRYGDFWWDFCGDMNATDGYPVRCMKE